jgi:hypothetical protein
VRGFALFAATSAVLIGAAAWVLSLVNAAPAEVHSIRVGAAIAFVVQLFTFAIARLSARTNVIAGWGVGALVRLVTLGVYALVVVPAVGLTPNAPIYMLVFLFVTMVVEPLFLPL